MKKNQIIFLALFSTLLFACESPIYHNFEVVNKTTELITVKSSFVAKPDSVVTFYLMPDSIMHLFTTDDMQGFFTDKILSRQISTVFKTISATKDSLSSETNFLIDSIWDVQYTPGKYTYKLFVKNEDF